VLLAVLLYVIPAVATAQSLVIENGVLIDGNGGPPVSGAVVVVQGQKIAAVGQKGKIDYPKDAKVIDASGKYILPGFIDMHVHYHDWLGEIFLNHGITTVYDFCTKLPEHIMAIKLALEKGKIVGPRMYFVGPALGYEDTNISTGVRNEKEVHDIIEHAASLGVDGIKIQLPNLPPELLKVVVEDAHKRGLPVGIHVADDPEVMTARQAVEIGVNMLLHAGGMAISMVQDPAKRKRFLDERLPINEGGGDPWHLVTPEAMDEFVKFLVSKNVYWNPTNTSVWRSANPLQPAFAQEIERIFSDPGLSYMALTSQYEDSTRGAIPYLTLWQEGSWAATPQDQRFTAAERERQAKSFKQFQMFTKKFFDAGGKILPGSDPVGSGVPGIGFHHEMEMLVAMGIPASQVLSFATKWSAEYIRHGKELGTIEAGKLADIVVLGGDPVADIRNTKKIEMVIKGGQQMTLGYHPTYYTVFPDPVENFKPRSAVQSLRFKISPLYATEGDRGVELTVKSAAGLWKSATVYMNNVPLPTQWIGSGELRATVPEDAIRNAGLYKVRIKYPGPTGGFSPPVSFVVGYR
jgi:imidazolonepropionase-like amidohydrolase